MGKRGVTVPSCHGPPSPVGRDAVESTIERSEANVVSILRNQRLAWFRTNVPFPLTPTLSPEEREKEWLSWWFVDPGLRLRVREIARKSCAKHRHFVFAPIRTSTIIRSNSTRRRFSLSSGR